MPMLSLLISVSFYTILERKLLGYIQIRKGPNKVGILGVLQPFSDAIKLFNKNLISPSSINFSLFYLSPSLSLMLTLIISSIIPFNSFTPYNNKFNIIMFFLMSSLMVYSLLWIGWSSNSKYAHMGAIRSIAQMISYEISLFIIILSISLLSNSYSLTQISESQYMLYFIWGNLILFFMWISSCLAETNRSPFDFAEGESELVSGFNVEFMGGWFALIFLAEYLSMLILSLMTSFLFFSHIFNTSIIFLILITLMLLWVRGSYPRFRYDLLMHMSWKIFLPTSLFLIPLSILSLSISM